MSVVEGPVAVRPLVVEENPGGRLGIVVLVHLEQGGRERRVRVVDVRRAHFQLRACGVEVHETVTRRGELVARVRHNGKLDHRPPVNRFLVIAEAAVSSKCRGRQNRKQKPRNRKNRR
eukprot:Amastigsp_a508696_247.p2 type:complete len:118 gc:universal Amastigsp_a508696_247:803-1156(+)